jgi:Flp pilus assembly protein TadG
MSRSRFTLCANCEGQSLIGAALMLPLLLSVLFNAVNAGYFFFVYLNLSTAPRQGAEYSIQGLSTYQQSALPGADSVQSLVQASIQGAIPSAANVPIRVCSLSLGLDPQSIGGGNQIPLCNSYGSGTANFSTVQADPEAPYLVLNRVDIQYTVTPLIQGAIFNLVFPSSLNFQRTVYMRAQN